ncbi:hypothetical protein BZA05DRAFT_439654 [Tricharina praecox]|uniref:uncharacterized protein n=1 Tax=Tricharina praecox TaxID=43433 RepID=UPI00221E8D85|nr:uncharacterized protein BZA05DRAFT_439654 [Tricharina praecox]KAI5842003.1 hypothetical protein BZA05DRAFT_439654 [Tricharina praecox]
MSYFLAALELPRANNAAHPPPAISSLAAKRLTPTSSCGCATLKQYDEGNTPTSERKRKHQDTGAGATELAGGVPDDLGEGRGTAPDGLAEIANNTLHEDDGGALDTLKVVSDIFRTKFPRRSLGPSSWHLQTEITPEAESKALSRMTKIPLPRLLQDRLVHIHWKSLDDDQYELLRQRISTQITPNMNDLMSFSGELWAGIIVGVYRMRSCFCVRTLLTRSRT